MKESAFIHAEAVFNIAATVANDGSGGLFFDGDPVEADRCKKQKAHTETNGLLLGAVPGLEGTILRFGISSFRYKSLLESQWLEESCGGFVMGVDGSGLEFVKYEENRNKYHITLI